MCCMPRMHWSHSRALRLSRMNSCVVNKRWRISARHLLGCISASKFIPPSCHVEDAVLNTVDEGCFWTFLLCFLLVNKMIRILRPSHRRRVQEEMHLHSSIVMGPKTRNSGAGEMVSGDHIIGAIRRTRLYMSYGRFCDILEWLGVPTAFSNPAPDSLTFSHAACLCVISHLYVMTLPRFELTWFCPALASIFSKSMHHTII